MRHALSGNIVYYMLLALGVKFAGVAPTSLIIGILPITVTLALIVYLFAVLMTRKTALGLFIEAVGSNEVASRYAGLSSSRVKLMIYGFSGF